MSGQSRLKTKCKNIINGSVGGHRGQGGRKRISTRKFVDRVEMTLKLHTAADPIPKPNNTLPRIRTQYMHENRCTKIRNPQNDGNSSQASTTSAKRKRGQRGKYKYYVIEKKTLGGTAKLVVDIPDYVLQAVGENARNLVNFCGHIVRTKALMDASPWIQVATKHGDAMWLLVKKICQQNSKNRKSDKWCQHTRGTLSFPEVENILTKKNGDVKPSADVIWLAEHTRTNDQGLLEWVNDGRSKKIHEDLHQLVQDKDKERAPQTQEDMLLHVLGPKSEYTRGKGSGYGGSIRSRIQEDQQKKS